MPQNWSAEELPALRVLFLEHGNAGCRPAYIELPVNGLLNLFTGPITHCGSLNVQGLDQPQRSHIGH